MGEKKEAREDKLLQENPGSWRAQTEQEDKQAERKRERLGKPGPCDDFATYYQRVMDEVEKKTTRRSSR
jgi:hypothetical protein